MTATLTKPRPSFCNTAGNLHVAICRESAGPIIYREAVRPADLLDARSELWLESHLRKGRPDFPLADMAYDVIPIFDAEKRDQVTSFKLVCRDDGASEQSLLFTIGALDRVAVRAEKYLLGEGVLKDKDKYYYHLGAGELDAAAAVTAMPDGRFSMKTRDLPLRFVTAPIQPLLDKAISIGTPSVLSYPVFYTRAAFDAAERHARLGATLEKKVETGAVLIGALCSCPDTGEFYSVVAHVIEVQEAQQTQFSLTLSGESWQRIQNAIRAMQSRKQTRAFRLLGQAHGHPFIVHKDKKGACETCPDRPNCSHTSVFVSKDDVGWSRDVFPRQPWQLCHIFGQDARGTLIDGLFGQRDCTLSRRPFYVIDDFDPAQA